MPGGIEDSGGTAVNLAYLAICAFLLVLLAVLARTVVLYGLLLLLPLARLLRWVPGMTSVLARVERRVAEKS